jgi:hypothetical protein
MRLPLLYTCRSHCFIVRTVPCKNCQRITTVISETRESLLACSQSDRRPNRIWATARRRTPAGVRAVCCGCCTDLNHALLFPSFVSLHRIQNPKRAAGRACMHFVAVPDPEAGRHAGTQARERYALVPSPSLPGRRSGSARTPSSLPACLPAWCLHALDRPNR